MRCVNVCLSQRSVHSFTLQLNKHLLTPEFARVWRSGTGSLPFWCSDSQDETDSKTNWKAIRSAKCYPEK